MGKMTAALHNYSNDIQHIVFQLNPLQPEYELRRDVDLPPVLSAPGQGRSHNWLG